MSSFSKKICSPHRHSRGTVYMFFMMLLCFIIIWRLFFDFVVVLIIRDRALDEHHLKAALAQAKFYLPEEEKARAFVENYIAVTVPLTPEKDVLTVKMMKSRDGLVANISRLQTAPLFNIIGKIIDISRNGIFTKTDGFRFETTASVRFYPREAAFFMDKGKLLAPDLQGNEFFSHIENTAYFSPWIKRTSQLKGTTQFPMDPYSIQHPYRFKKGKCKGPLCKQQAWCAPQDYLCKQIMVQQCFSPPLMAQKNAAYIVFDEFSMSPANSVGMYVGPENINGAPRALRKFGRVNSRLKKSEVDKKAIKQQFLTQQNYVPLNNKSNKRRSVNNIECLRSAAFAEYEVNGYGKRDFNYDVIHENRLPTHPSENAPEKIEDHYFGYPYQSYSQVTEKLLMGQDPEFLDRANQFNLGVASDESLLANNLNNYLTVRKALWAQAVHPEASTDFPRTLTKIADDMFKAGKRTDLPEHIQRQAVKSITLFLGDYPHAFNKETGKVEPFFNADNQLNTPVVNAVKESLRKLRARVRKKQKEFKHFQVFIAVLRHSNHPFNCSATNMTGKVPSRCKEYFERFNRFEKELSRFVIEDGEKPRPFRVVTAHIADPYTLGSQLPDILSGIERSGHYSISQRAIRPDDYKKPLYELRK